VELLVVIAIIGVLVSLLMPAVQSARESARSAQCKNHLRQIGLGAAHHLQSQEHFPSSGWGFRWTGDPDMGFGHRQPGGWGYNLLPYIEQQSVHDIGKGLTGTGSGGAKYNKLAEQKSAALSIFYCPSRRRAVAYPSGETSYNAAQPATLAKTDYAANGGTNRILGGGPSDVNCLSTYPNCDWAHTDAWLNANFDGISGERSQITRAHLRDGASHTIFAGEKYLNPNKFTTGDDGADNNSMYQGNDWDVNRWTGDSGDFYPPMRDTPGYGTTASRFGGPHIAGFHAVLCDGSVQTVRYSIAASVYKSLGSRADGAANGNPFQ
jgi:hypothetical protein